MNILQLRSDFGDCGPGTQPLEIAKRLRSRGHTVVFASSGGAMVSEIEAQGFRHVTIASLAVRARDPVSTLRNVRALASVMRANDIQAVHGHNAASTLCALAAARLTGRFDARVFQSVRGLETRGTHRWRNWIYRANYARYFAVAQFTKNWLLELGVREDNIVVTYNGVDLGRFDPKAAHPDIRKELGIPKDALVLAHVGAFSGWKGQDVLVRAIEALLPKFPKVVALLVGTGDRPFEDAKRIAGELRVADRVVFAGYRRDIPAIQAAADVYCQPSTQGEMFPNAILEAMAMGNPWVGSDLSGLGELTDGGQAGLVSSPGDLDALVANLTRVLADSDLRLRMGRAARAFVEREFSIDRVVDRIEGAYTDSRRRP